MQERHPVKPWPQLRSNKKLASHTLEGWDFRVAPTSAIVHSPHLQPPRHQTQPDQIQAPFSSSQPAVLNAHFSATSILDLFSQRLKNQTLPVAATWARRLGCF